MTEQLDKMQLAKGRLAMYAGFWLALSSKLQWIPSTQLPTAGTDGRRVLYNRNNMDPRPLGEVVYIALHEIGHNMMAHPCRLGGRDKQIANIAMDIVLNEALDKIAAETPELKMVTPDDACTYDKFGVPPGLTFEAVYALLMKNAKKTKAQGSDGQGGAFDEVSEGTNDDGSDMTQADKEALAKDWQVATQAAAVMAKQQGKLPGFMEEFINELIKPKVDWRNELRHCLTRVTNDESSYRRFNRRHVSRGHYLPGYYSERIGAIGYFCDTSGSISTDEFKAGMGAMTDILEDLRPEAIYFGQCDTQLHSVDKLTPDDLPLPPLKVQGRGGTDMREAFEWACAHEDEIDAFILQTDLYIPPLDPKLVPNVPVIWLVTTDAPVPDGCDFGRMIRIVL